MQHTHAAHALMAASREQQLWKLLATHHAIYRRFDTDGDYAEPLDKRTSGSRIHGSASIRLIW